MVYSREIIDNIEHLYFVRGLNLNQITEIVQPGYKFVAKIINAKKKVFQMN